MTVANNISKHEYVGNGVNREWPFSFILPESGGAPDVSVIQVFIKVGDAVSSLVSTSNYAVDTERNVVMYPLPGNDPLTADTKILIYRILDFTQALDLANGGSFFAEDIETALDKAVMLLQQLKEQTDRTLILDKGDTRDPLQTVGEVFAAREESLLSAEGAKKAKDETLQAKLDTLQAQATTEEARDVTLAAKEETLTAKDITLQAQATTEKTKADAITEINELTAKSTSDIETAKKVVTDIQADVVTKQTEINQTSETAVTAKNDAVEAKNITLQAKTETVQAKDITLTAKDETLTAKGKVEELLDGIETVPPATTTVAGKVMLAEQEDITAGSTTKVPTAGAVKQKLDPILAEIEVLKKRTTTGYVDNARKANTATNAEKLNGYTSSYFRCSNACSWTCSFNCTGSCMAGCTACSSCTGSCTSCTNACSQACSSGCRGTCTTSCAGCGGRD